MSDRLTDQELDELRMRAWSAGGAALARWEALVPEGWQDDRTLIVARSDNYKQTIAEVDDIDEAAHIATADPRAVMAMAEELIAWREMSKPAAATVPTDDDLREAIGRAKKAAETRAGDGGE